MLECAYYNGVITPYDSASIPLSDRAIFFADAVYDVVIGRCGIPYQLDEHLTRLLNNASAIGVSIFQDKNKIKDAVKMTLDESDADDFLLYVQISANAKRRAHSRCNDEANLLITVTALDVPNTLESFRAILLPDVRYGYCNLKTTNLLPSVLSISTAESRDADIAIFHKNEIITEASHANVSIIKDGVLITHPLNSSILPGISEVNLIKACEKLGIAHTRREFSIDELKNADVALITSTTKLMRVCAEIDGIAVKCKDMHTAEAIFTLMRDDLILNTSL